MAAPKFTAADLDAARLAIRRGAQAGHPIPRCRCFSGGSVILAVSACSALGACEEAAEHVAAAIAAGRADLYAALAEMVEIYRDDCADADEPACIQRALAALAKADAP